MVNLDLFRSKKHWKIKAFEKHTKDMTFEQGRAYTTDIVKAIKQSKKRLAKYDSDFFEKLGYSRDGEVDKYAWNSFKQKRFKAKHDLSGRRSSDIYDPVFRRRIHSYVTGTSKWGLLDALLMNKILDQRYEAKDSSSAKKLISELKWFFSIKRNVSDWISDEQLAIRINNNIDTGFTLNYIVYLLKNDDAF